MLHGDKMSFFMVQKLHPNNYTTTKEKNVVVNFKKLKEKGE